MKRGLCIAGIILGVLFIGLVSAGLLDILTDMVTGYATNQPTNVSVNVTGINPVNITVDNSTLTGGVTPTEASSTSSVFYVKVCDPNGVGDINDSSVQGEFIKGAVTRTNISCSLIGDLDTYCANYSCTIDTWYWDAVGTWTINASATDLGNQTRIHDNTKTFTMNQLKAMVISPSQLQWAEIYPGQTDKKADNDPTIVNNTGNYDGVINIAGLDLYGQIIITEVFGVSNFTADETDATCAGGTYLVNATSTAITGTNSNPGNLTAGGGAGQEEIYYCIPSVPLVLSSQEYTTNILGSWTILF